MLKSSFETKTIGDILRTKRKEKGLEIKQVAEITRIRAEYLKALETGAYKIFPSEVYVKGFLKNYAKFLGIRAEKAQAMYRRENKQIQAAEIEQMKLKKSRFDFALTPEKLIIAIVTIITVSIVYYIVSQVSTITQKPELTLSSPVLVSAEETENFETEETTVDIKGSVSTGATLKLNGDEITTNNLQQFEVRDLELNPGENEFVFVAESQFGRQTKLSLIVSRPTEIEQPPDTTSGTEDVPEAPQTITEMKMTITIVQDIANVRVVTDGQSQINQVLQPGTSREFTAKQSIIVQTPRPSFVKIKINGQEFEITTTEENEWKIVNGVVKKTK